MTVSRDGGRDRDQFLRRQALYLAAQLPETDEEAQQVVKYLDELLRDYVLLNNTKPSLKVVPGCEPAEP